MRRLDVLSGIACLGHVEPLLSDMNKGDKISLISPVLPRPTLWRRIGQRRTCASMRV